MAMQSDMRNYWMKLDKTFRDNRNIVLEHYLNCQNTHISLVLTLELDVVVELSIDYYDTGKVCSSQTSCICVTCSTKFKQGDYYGICNPTKK